jgi:hypothetical protein
MWKDISYDMFWLWSMAVNDLLCEAIGYKLQGTERGAKVSLANESLVSKDNLATVFLSLTKAYNM